MNLTSTRILIAVLILSPTVMFKTSIAFAKQDNTLAAEAELADMDAAAAMLGSIRSWVGNEPEAAIAAFENYTHVRQYADQKCRQYSGTTISTVHRSGDRVKAMESGIKTWEEFLPMYHEKQPKQIATELKRQRDAVERYKRSNSPRPGSFAYIPKTVWQTKDRLDVLTASGAETAELRTEQAEIQAMVLDLLATLDAETIAKKNGIVRDAYKQADRESIESCVTEHWTGENPDQAIARIVMPKSSWSNTYSARFDVDLNRIIADEIDRMTVYVATRKTDAILTLQPVRLMRKNFKVNGKRLGQTQPQSAIVIPTNEFSFDVLEVNIR